MLATETMLGTLGGARCSRWFALLAGALCAVACGGGDDSDGKSGAGGSGAVAGSGGADGGGTGGGAGTPPLLTSALSDCAPVSSACLTVDLGAPAHTISPALFGDGIEWTTHGLTVLDPDPTGQTSGTLRPDVIDALADVGFTHMRYPGGTLSDSFHWNQAIGPVSSRIPQSNLSFNATTGQLETELPLFGPDELVDFVGQLKCEIMLTVNVMTGTAEEAAGWLSYWKSKGVRPSHVEIGNEAYLALVDPKVMPAMAPEEYAKRFDEWATAIRAVDPTLSLGAIGTNETSSWCYPNCAAPPPWNQVVLQTIQQKIDFFSIHNAYAPGASTTDAATYQAMLGYPDFIRFADGLIEADVELFANSASKGMPLAKTEFASYFLPPPGADIATIQSVVGQNQSWGAALYSGLVLQTLVSDPRIWIANHINPLHYLWQAPIVTSFPDFATYPSGYQPNPTLSAYGSVFKGYRELASQRFVAVTPANVPTISTQAIGVMPARDDIPVLDAVAALNASGEPPRGWLFLVNRSLDSDVKVSIVLRNIPSGAALLEMEVLNAPDYTAKNLPGQPPVVSWTTLVSGQLPSGSAPFGLELTVPKHSLVRVRVHG